MHKGKFGFRSDQTNLAEKNCGAVASRLSIGVSYRPIAVSEEIEQTQKAEQQPEELPNDPKSKEGQIIRGNNSHLEITTTKSKQIGDKINPKNQQFLPWSDQKVHSVERVLERCTTRKSEDKSKPHLEKKIQI